MKPAVGVRMDAYDTEPNKSIPEARLLAAVVACAIRDTLNHCPKGADRYAMDQPARKAMEFLFGAHSGLESYALWLDFNADEFRKRLLIRMHSDDEPLVYTGEGHAKKPRFTDGQKRAFRENWQAWTR